MSGTGYTLTAAEVAGADLLQQRVAADHRAPRWLDAVVDLPGPETAVFGCFKKVPGAPIQKRHRKTIYI
jgi:hypothetical protein